jgi:hypothetical protein
MFLRIPVPRWFYDFEVAPEQIAHTLRRGDERLLLLPRWHRHRFHEVALLLEALGIEVDASILVEPALKPLAVGGKVGIGGVISRRLWHGGFGHFQFSRFQIGYAAT